AHVAVVAGHEEAAAGPGPGQGVGDGDGRIVPDFLAAPEAAGGVELDVLGHIDLDPGDSEHVLELGVGPGLAVVATRIGGRRHRDPGRQPHLRARAERLLVLVAAVQIGPYRAMRPVDVQAVRLHGAVFAPDSAVAV